MNKQPASKKVTHTPGPWSASDIDQRGVYACGGASLVATVHTTTLPESDRPDRMDVTAANARLIAAAPDLLEIAVAVTAGGMSYPKYLVDRATAAIAKTKPSAGA